MFNDKKNCTDTNICIEEILLNCVASAAVACQPWVGKDDSNKADLAAVNAIKQILTSSNAHFEIKTGEGERDKAPMLYSGEHFGKKLSHCNTSAGFANSAIGIAVDPLENTNACKNNLSDSLSVICANNANKMISAPDVYMNKLATAKHIPDGLLSITNKIEDNILNLASFLNKLPQDVSVCVLERDKNRSTIEGVKRCGAKLILIQDGDVLAILKTHPLFGSIDLYAGIGGAPEGMLVSGFIQLTGGFFEGQFLASTEEQLLRMKQKNLNTKTTYVAKELIGEDPFFCISFVTDSVKPKPRLIKHGDKLVYEVHVFKAQPSMQDKKSEPQLSFKKVIVDIT
ncbi:MAG: fructose-bisphosphatase class II [Alphaproteobacteria bacterium]|nr:fructose-bisphosphatase class II [Rickettsiales bacterium]